MRRRVHLVSIPAISLALTLVVQAAHAVDPSSLQRGPTRAPIQQLPPQGAPVPLTQPPAQKFSPPAAIKGEQLTKQQFDALPDTTVIDFRGTRITAGEARARIKQAETAAQAEAQAAAAQAQAKFEAYRAKFLQDQKAKLQDAHVKARAEIARLRKVGAAPLTQQQTIQKEAVELLNRSKTAPPAEQAQIEQRALQLQQQYQQPKSLQQAPRLQQVPR